MDGHAFFAAPRTFFGGFPEHGPWTALALGRGQFLAILGLSLALFAFVDGPVWLHVRTSHFTRIVISYGVIPVAVAAALIYNYNRRASLFLLIAGSVMLALIKLVATAALLVALALAG